MYTNLDVLQLTGLTDTCYCNTCQLNRLQFPKYGGFMDFETYDFYRKNFNIAWIWAFCAAIGALLPTAVFAAALVWWLKCRDLWSADERKGPSIKGPGLLAWLQ